MQKKGCGSRRTLFLSQPYLRYRLLLEFPSSEDPETEDPGSDQQQRAGLGNLGGRRNRGEIVTSEKGNV